MATGVVRSFNVNKGFGFIGVDGSDTDMFVHIRAVKASGLRDLREDQKVSFDVVKELGRDAANNIKLL